MKKQSLDRMQSRLAAGSPSKIATDAQAHRTSWAKGKSPKGFSKKGA